MDLKEMIEERLLDKNGNPSRMKKRQHAEFLEEVLTMNPHEDVNTSLYMTYFNVPCRLCRLCSAPLRIKNFKIGWEAEWCSIKCRDSDPEFKKEWRKRIDQVDHNARLERQRLTNLERYGVEYALQIPELAAQVRAKNAAKMDQIRANARKTNLERYGVEYTFQAEEVKARIKEANLEKYGVEYPMQSEEVKDKVRTSMLEKYGVENAFQAEEVKQKIIKTNLKKYGKERPQDLPPEIKQKLTGEWLIREYTENQRTITDIASELGVSGQCVSRHCKSLGIEIRKNSHYSMEEVILLDRLREIYEFEIIHQKRIKRNREIDIWIPDHKLGIEVNGIYWHSEETGKGKWYHWVKTNAMRQRGWHLIHFTDWDVNNRLDWCLEVVDRNVRKDYPSGDVDLNLYPPVLRGWVEIVSPRAIPNDRYSLGVGDRTYWDVGLMRK